MFEEVSDRMADSRFPKMTAKTVMAQILEEQVISKGDLFKTALKTVRELKMGVMPPMKLHAQLFAEEDFPREATVEKIVR